MSIQTLINNATSISMSKNKVSGQTISRGGWLKTSQFYSTMPWTISLTMSPGIRYTDVGIRDFLSDLDQTGIETTESVEIGASNPGLSWINSYQGNLSQANLDLITIDNSMASPTGSVFTLNVSAVSVDAGTLMFKKGDFIQPDTGYKYPYMVTENVYRGAGSTVGVPVHRPIIDQAGYTFGASKGILVGTAVTWQVRLLSLPTYTLTPDRLIEWGGDIVLMEVLEG